MKLADFGASKRVEAFGLDPEKVMEELTVRGTPYFMVSFNSVIYFVTCGQFHQISSHNIPHQAPEVFEEKYGPKADIWSVGGVVFQMSTGENYKTTCRNTMRILIYNISFIMFRLTTLEEPWSQEPH